MSFIYKASFKTNMYCLPVVDVDPVAAVIIGMFVMGLYVSEKGATLHDHAVSTCQSCICMRVKIRSAAVRAPLVLNPSIMYYIATIGHLDWCKST